MFYSVSHFPSDASSFNYENFISLVNENLEDPSFIALGETGLDFVEGADDYEEQKVVFKTIISIAKLVKKPIIVHARNSLDSALDILEEFDSLPNVVIHCFDGNSEQLKRIHSNGFFVSYNGLITYNDRNKELIAAIKEEFVPELSLLETDAPYLSPGIYRGKLNSAKYLKIVSDRIAKELKLNKYLLFEEMNNNSYKFFNL